ncbi:3-hydroxyisobutyrate dehydrogenase-like beta-hydroxyacid dehydrogenase [Paraburkholderia sp. 32]
MGAPMIRRLLRAGHSVHVWNRTRAKAEALRAEGAHVIDTPRALARRVADFGEAGGGRTARRGSAYETGTPMPVASTVQQLLRLGAAMGLADADFSAFIDILQTPRGGSNG